MVNASTLTLESWDEWVGRALWGISHRCIAFPPTKPTLHSITPHCPAASLWKGLWHQMHVKASLLKKQAFWKQAAGNQTMDSEFSRGNSQEDVWSFFFPLKISIHLLQQPFPSNLSLITETLKCFLTHFSNQVHLGRLWLQKGWQCPGLNIREVWDILHLTEPRLLILTQNFEEIPKGQEGEQRASVAQEKTLWQICILASFKTAIFTTYNIWSYRPLFRNL